MYIKTCKGLAVIVYKRVQIKWEMPVNKVQQQEGNMGGHQFTP